MNDFPKEVSLRIAKNACNKNLMAAAEEFMRQSILAKYSYNFGWLGRPVIQYPQDIVAVQEIIWETRPDLVIETGIAHGGSLVLTASMLAMLDISDAITDGKPFDWQSSRRSVLGIDVDIRLHNRMALEAHPFFPWIHMMEGSSVDPETVARVVEAARHHGRVMVCLDSNHTHDHVLAELEAYAPLVSAGNYCVVFDTVVESLPADYFSDRPWGQGDNPLTATKTFLARHPDFVCDHSITDKLLATAAPGGYLRRVR